MHHRLLVRVILPFVTFGQLATSPAHSGALFGDPLRVQTGGTPIAVAVADLNGDGLPDLAVANYSPYPNGIAVLLGNGVGSFREPAWYAMSTPRAIGVGDLSGDGALDLVTATDGYVSIYLGNGDGSFSPIRGDHPTGADARSLVLGDLNGDGHLDAVLAAGYQGISILFGNGNGAFANSSQYPAGNYAMSVAMADMNFDGTQDVAVVNGDASCPGGYSSCSGPAYVFPGNGDGTLAPRLESSTAGYSNGVTVSDLNGDGLLDLATSNSLQPEGFAGTASILLGRGDGTCEPHIDYGVGTNPNSIIAVDLNRDGHVDLVTTNHNSANVSVLLGHGNGTFAPKLDFPTGYAGDAPTSVAVGDFNQDGWPDLVVTNSNSGRNDVSVFLNSGLFPTGVETPSARTNGLSAAIYPNPVNPRGSLTFTTTQSGPVRASLFDAAGRLVRVLMNETDLPAGIHDLPIDAGWMIPKGLASGVYFYRIDARDGVASGRVVIAR